MKKTPLSILKNGLIDENPVFVQTLGMCPLLAVSTNAINALGMGISTMIVLVCSNFFISALRKVIPAKIRIPCYIVLIASFVTIVDFLVQAFAPGVIYAALGIFVPLIVVNCIVLARAESFASKNKPLPSLIDGFAMGLGFTVALMLLGLIREFLGAGTLFTVTVLPESVPRTVMMILPPGAFFTLAFLLALLNYRRGKR